MFSRHSIQHKLTLTLVGLIAFLLISTLFFARQSFTNGFADYINDLELARLSQLAMQIAPDYQENGSWPDDIGDSFMMYLRIRPPHREAPQDPRSRPPRPPRESHPPHHAPPPHGGRQGPHPTALFDAQGGWLAGDPHLSFSKESISVPVLDQGRIIGHVQSAPLTRISAPLEQAFASRQLEGILIIGVLSLLLAILTSGLLTRRLMLPIRQLIHDISELSAGNYDIPPREPRHDELGILVRDVNSLAATLRETRHTRRRMFADISHELRTPLTILSAEVEAVRDEVRPFDEHTLTSLEQEILRLRYLVDDLYELSTADMGALSYTFQDHDMQEVVARTLATLGQDKQEGITVHAALEPAVARMDVRRMEQLMRNLMLNSMTYTNTPGRIEVRLIAHEQEITLSICDSAPGVQDEEYALLFESLYRTPYSRNKRASGAGLGLAICKKIVEAHKGTILATLSPLGGLCVTVTIPIR